MSIEENKAVVGRWFTEFWGENFNPDVIGELAAPDIRFEYSLHTPCRGRDEVRAFATKFRAAFPDLAFGATADLIAEGNLCHPNTFYFYTQDEQHCAEFVAAVEKTGRKNLIMAGVTTDVCLVFPTISAVRAGYNVQAVMDASGSPFEISEEMARRRMEREGVVLTATNTVMAELAQDWSRPEGGQLLGVLFSEVLPKIG